MGGGSGSCVLVQMGQAVRNEITTKSADFPKYILQGFMQPCTSTPTSGPISRQIDEMDGSSLEQVCKSVEGRTSSNVAVDPRTTAAEGESAAAMTVKTVESTLQLRSELEDAEDKLVVVEFYAPW